MKMNSLKFLGLSAVPLISSVAVPGQKNATAQHRTFYGGRYGVAGHFRAVLVSAYTLQQTLSYSEYGTSCQAGR